jgi:hypothetical protein
VLPQRKKRNSSKVNLLISLAFHSVLVVLLFFFAAREGLLGKQLKKIAVTMVPKEKPPEKPKEDEPKPKMEEPKVEQPRLAEAPKSAPPARTAEAPPPTAAPAAAPPAATIPSFDFAGGKVVETTSNPIQLYKSFVEYTLRTRWNRPENVQDDDYVAEIDLSIDSSGLITSAQWQKGSGDTRWDESVKRVLAETRNIGRLPPKNFPDHFLVRFDVQAGAEPIPILQ